MLDTVLIVDDSDADLLYTQLVVERVGCARRVLALEHAREALHGLEQGRLAPELILLDINMPGMDGFEFLDALDRLAPRLARPPAVVMLTSSSDPADRSRAMGHDCVRGYLTKPIDKEAASHLAAFLEKVRA